MLAALEIPLIDPRYFSDEADLDRMEKGAVMMRSVIEAPAFEPYRGKMLYYVRANDRQAIREDIRNRPANPFAGQ